MDDCIFCKIASGTLSVPTVYEDDMLIAFIDLHPLNPGHTLVIPKKHFDAFTDMPSELFGRFMTTAHEIGQKVHRAFPSYRLGMVVKGFDVAHAHLHLFPQLSASDINSKFSPELPPVAPTPEREVMAEKIRNAVP